MRQIRKSDTSRGSIVMVAREIFLNKRKAARPRLTQSKSHNSKTGMATHHACGVLKEEDAVNSETATATDTPDSSRELELFTPAEPFTPSEQGRARARQLGMPESAGEFSPEQVQSFLKALREFDNISGKKPPGYRYDKFPDYAYATRKRDYLLMV